ncbi:MAG: GDP-mannose 4,6-dehydratase [Candidatus Gastranaerophilales bacterium]|nr:GDP-mannose 4,6-dehydratase [Candidatus Gastranaerophilales bacterium]
MAKTALITGITGQDGAYLAQFLLCQGYSVIGLTRNTNVENLKKLKYLGIDNKIILQQCDLFDMASLLNILEKFNPSEIYNLASQSSVRLSFINPAETLQFNVLSTLNLLNAVKLVLPNSKFYQASSSEMYGNVEELPITEKSVLHPVSPYAISKATAHSTAINYRETYGLYACCGILFNHISYLSNNNFFIKKVINSAINIKNGLQKDLKVGNIEVKRDFGYAPDYIKAMWQMLQLDNPQEFIISSGKSVCLKEILFYIFDKFKISRNKIIIDKTLYRPNEIINIYGDNSGAKEILGWEYNKSVFDILDIIIEEEIANEQANKCII